MAEAIPIISAVTGVVGLGASLLSRQKVETPKALPVPTKNQAAERAALNDDLARRQGTRANRRTGYGGAEASTDGKTSLLGR